MKTKYILLSTVLLPFMLSGQNKFGNNLGTTSPSAVVEMESPSKGVLLPRVALTGTTDATTITSPATYLTVFNTATASDVTPGYYYWNDTKWIRMLIDSDLGSTAWLLSGNANGALKTIGTTDAYDFPFIVNNTEAMRSIWDATNSTTRVAVGTTKADTVASATSGSTAIRRLSKFTVSGGDAMINHLTVGVGGAQMSNNTVVGYRVLYNNTATGTGNTGIGYLALTANTTGWGNVANGYKALIANTTGWKNTANGCWALYSNTSGADNVATGGQALYSNTTGSWNTATGYNALGLNIDGNNNDAHGYESVGSLTTGERNAGFGIRALSSLTSGGYNTGLGCYAGSNLTSGNFNTAVGQGQLFADPTGSYQLNISGAIFGTGLSGNVSAPAGKIGIGLTAPVQTLAVKDSMGISNGTYYNSFNTKSTQAANISYTLPSTKATAAGQVLTNDGTGVLSWAGLGSSAWLLGGNTNGALKTIGTTDAYDFPFIVNNTEAMRAIWDATNSIARVAVGTTTAATVAASTSSSTSSKQLAILTTPAGYDAYINDIVIGRGGGQGSSIVYGYQSLYNNTSGSANSSFGDWSLYSNTTGSNNVAMGVITLYKNTTGNSNMALGYGSLYNNTTGNNNLSIGYASNRGNTTGTGNVAIGDSTLYNNLALTSGSNNTALGRSAAKICTGSSNIAIGANQGLLNTAGNNQLNIGGAIFGTGLSGSVSAPAGKIGIGVTAPVQTLAVKDSMGISNGTYYNSFNTKSTQAANISYTLPTAKATAAGQVLTNDGTGALSWAATSATAWSLTGNAGTTAGTNFIGTTDDVDLVFKRGGSQAGRISGSTLSNTSFGLLSLKANTTGDQNTAIGTSAMTSNTTGYYNTAIGCRAMSLANSSVSVAIGRSALENAANSSGNTAVGTYSFINCNSSNNTAVGFSSGYYTTTGTQNTIVGSQTLYANTTGSNNTALGSSALYASTTASNNTAIGFTSLFKNTTGYSNTAVGASSLLMNTTGSRLVAIGDSALLKSTGKNNTSLGYNAGGNLTSGDNNIIIGSGQADLLSNTGSNQLNIGGAIFGTGLSGSVSAPAGKIGIGVTAPVQTLAVKDSMGISNGTYYNSFNTKSTQAANISYTLPTTKATAAGQVLTNDGNGNLSWTSTTSIVTKTAAYTALATDETILVNATSAAVTITLPAPVAGKKYIVKKIDTSTNAVIVATTSGTIDGAASISGALSYQGWVFQTDGTNWYIIGKF